MNERSIYNVLIVDHSIKRKGHSIILMTLAIVEIIKMLICDSACEMHEKHSVTKSINKMLRVRTQTNF